MHRTETNFYAKAWALFEKGLLPFLFVALLIANFLLIKKVNQLNSNIVQLKSEEMLKIGTSVPPIKATRVDGVQEQIAYNRSNLPTVLYVFSPQCGWCKKNLPNLHILASQNGKTYRLIGLSLSDRDLKQYVIAEHLDFPIYYHLDDSALAVYHLGGTPTTIIVSPQGKIENVWSGAYQEGTKEKIESALKVSLPGCCKS